MASRARTLGLLFTLCAACVINTRPHLPLEDDGGRAAAFGDASATFDAGLQTGVPQDASAVDGAVGADSAPPTASPDASAAQDGEVALEADDCLAADADRSDGGARRDAGDAGARTDGGDAGFTDSQGRSCVPASLRRDAAADDGRSGP
ncbi:MAG: hypothetical protein U0325_21710 [Polyangiales bacterium]